MTVLEEKLIEAGNKLARSLGHYSPHCPKVSHAVPCTCGAGAEQADVLAAWNRLVDDSGFKLPNRG